MTGHIPGTTVLRRGPVGDTGPGLGSNHVGLRAANERLVLSLIRTHGRLSKAQLAELSGLTAQTASVISRSLVEAGLLIAEAPVKGRIGQPYVPLSLNPDGAMFFGLRLESRQVRLALVNFVGEPVREETLPAPAGDMAGVARLAVPAIRNMRAVVRSERSDRFQGIGVVVPAAAEGEAPANWPQLDATFEALGQSLGLPVYVSSEAVAACSAELIYGLGGGISDFVYVFIDERVSGGLVQNGHIRFSRQQGHANIGRVLVPAEGGHMVPLSTLGLPEADACGDDAVNRLARGIAHACHAAFSVVNFEAVIVDGSAAPELMHRVALALRAALARVDAGAASSLLVREGSSRRQPTALGAACLPLADRFFPEQPARH